MPETGHRPSAAAIRDLAEEHMGREGALLPILHAVQARYGHVPEEALPVIAEVLNLSRAEVQGVVSFYHDFRDAPAGRRVIKVCRAEACQAVGAEALAAQLLERAGIGWGETTPDGALMVEPVYCLGLCACGPAALVDGVPRGRLDAGALEALLNGEGQ